MQFSPVNLGDNPANLSLWDSLIKYLQHRSKKKRWTRTYAHFCKSMYYFHLPFFFYQTYSMLIYYIGKLSPTKWMSKFDKSILVQVHIAMKYMILNKYLHIFYIGIFFKHFETCSYFCLFFLFRKLGNITTFKSTCM